MNQPTYISPVRRYGKTNWRVIVYQHPYYGLCTEYQWQRGQGPWEGEKDWPGYNSDHGDSGLPRSLRKHYLEFRSKIEAALEAREVDDFALVNAPPPHRPWQGEEPEPSRQKMLLDGLDCCAGQLDLFEEGGGA